MKKVTTEGGKRDEDGRWMNRKEERRRRGKEKGKGDVGG